MKKSLILLLLSIATLSYADDAKVVIKQKSGSETALQLSAKPAITFSGDDFVVTTDATTITLPLSDVDYYTVSEGTTGIAPVATQPQFIRGHVVFSGLMEDTPVYIHTLDGRVVGQQPADASGKADVSLDSLPKGVYVVSTPNNNIKVMVK